MSADVRLCFLHAVLFLHDEHGAPRLQQLVPSNLRDKTSEKRVGTCPGAAKTWGWEAEEGRIGL